VHGELDAQDEQDLINNLSDEKINQMMQQKPFSTKAKRTISWVGTDKLTGEKFESYVLTEEDREILKDYLKGDMVRFENMLKEVSRRRDLHPWQRSLPCHTKLGYKLGKYFVIVLYLAICFVLLQLALFNLILLGLMIMYLYKIGDTFTAMIIKAEVKYQNKGFLDFLKTQDELYKQNNITFNGGTQGQWIEVQLPDREDDTFKGAASPKANTIYLAGNNGFGTQASGILERPVEEEDDRA